MISSVPAPEPEGVAARRGSTLPKSCARFAVTAGLLALVTWRLDVAAALRKAAHLHPLWTTATFAVIFAASP